MSEPEKKKKKIDSEQLSFIVLALHNLIKI